jgi:alpha 1,2-mannosyltransferase
MTRPDNPIFQILDMECADENEQESGQIVIKRSKPGVYKALAMAFYMQQDTHVYYRLLHGDKDTFKYSWRYLGLSYHMVI